MAFIYYASCVSAKTQKYCMFLLYILLCLPKHTELVTEIKVQLFLLYTDHWTAER